MSMGYWIVVFWFCQYANPVYNYTLVDCTREEVPRRLKTEQECKKAMMLTQVDHLRPPDKPYYDVSCQYVRYRLKIPTWGPRR